MDHKILKKKNFQPVSHDMTIFGKNLYQKVVKLRLNCHLLRYLSKINEHRIFG